jgi:hypothetical protein
MIVGLGDEVGVSVSVLVGVVSTIGGVQLARLNIRIPQADKVIKLRACIIDLHKHIVRFRYGRFRQSDYRAAIRKMQLDIDFNGWVELDKSGFAGTEAGILIPAGARCLHK